MLLQQQLKSSEIYREIACDFGNKRNVWFERTMIAGSEVQIIPKTGS